jgi:hypothetical protein
MGLFTCCLVTSPPTPAPASSNPADQARIHELQQSLGQLQQQLAAARADATSARKTLTVAVRSAQLAPPQQQPSDLRADDAPAPADAAAAPDVDAKGPEQGHEQGQGAPLGLDELLAQVLFLEDQLHGCGPNTLAGLQQGSQQLAAQVEALGTRMAEMRAVGGCRAAALVLALPAPHAAPFPTPATQPPTAAGGGRAARGDNGAAEHAAPAEGHQRRHSRWGAAQAPAAPCRRPACPATSAGSDVGSCTCRPCPPGGCGVPARRRADPPGPPPPQARPPS